MKLHQRFNNFIQTNQIEMEHICEITGLENSQLDSFLDGTIDIMTSQHLDQLNKVFPELIAYTFEIETHHCELLN